MSSGPCISIRGWRTVAPGLALLPLDEALRLGVDVGKDPNVGMTSGAVVLVADEPFTDAVARRFAALVDMGGDVIHLPPFEWQRAGT